MQRNSEDPLEPLDFAMRDRTCTKPSGVCASDLHDSNDELHIA